MLKRIKVMTVIGTRPEIIRLSRVMARLDQHTDHTIVHTGQSYDYELSEIFFKDLELRQPDVFLNASGASAAETIGQIIIAMDKLLASNPPEAMLILGDTNSALAALPAKRRQIPIFHMEAGNRCFDYRVPEEINRRIVDVIADINLTYSTIARDYLLSEGQPADRVIKTGSPMFEVLSHFRDAIEKSTILQQLGLDRHQYFVVSAHREENVDSVERLTQLASMLSAIAEDYSLPIIVSQHPRTRARMEAAKLVLHPNVRFHKPFGFHDYNHLQLHARAVLSDSGTITEESSILNFPALNIREQHERPEGFEEASVMMTGFDIDRVRQALAILEGQARGDRRLLRQVADYSMDNVSEKVLRIIISYTDYVRRVVWKRY